VQAINKLIPFQQDSVGSRRIRKFLSLALILGIFQLSSFGLQIVSAPGAQAASTGAVSSFIKVSPIPGGGPGSSDCPTGSVLYEIVSSRGAIDNSSALTQTYGNCANLNDAGTQINAYTASTTSYGGAGNTPQSQWCGGAGSTRAITGARVYKTTNNYTSGIELICKDLPHSPFTGYLTGQLMGVNPVGKWEDITCPVGTFAVGLNVHSGGIIDAIGFNCAPVINATQASLSSATLSLSSKTYPYSTAISVSSSSGGSGAGAVSITSVTNGSAGGCAFSSNTISSSSAGTCTVTVTKAADLNYAATTRTETFTFNKAALTVTASSPDVNLGDAIPTITPIYSGFVNSENSSSPAFTTGLVAPTCMTSYTAASTVDTSPATVCSGGSSTGYSFSYVSGRVLILSGNDRAISLNGSSQSASASGAQVIPTSTASAFTVEAWIRQPASRSSGALYQILSQGTSGNEFYAKVVDGSVKFGRSGFTAEITCNVRVPTDEWTHVALVVGTSSQSCYINGSLAGSFTQTSTTAIGTTFAISRYVPAGGEFFLGQIDEVKIWSDARTQSEIQSDLKSYGGTLADNLVAYYDFNELVGSRIYNRSTGGSSAFNLTTVNSPTITSTSIIETSTVQAYTVVRFMRTFLVAAGGWTSPANVNSISYSVVGGGGGGGAGGYNTVSGMGGGGGGGGGGGQVVTQTSNISPGSLIPITVGQGGTGGLLGGRSSSGWGGTHGRNGGSSSIVIGGNTTTSAGGGYGLGGGFWGLTSPSSTACNTRNFTYDGLSVYYIDGIGGRGGNSGNGNTGGRPYCDSGTTTGVGGAGVGGAGNASSTSNLTSVSNSLQSGGAGTNLTTSGSSVEYGTGGSGGGGEGGGSLTPVVGASGTRPGMGGNGGAGSLRGNSSSIGAIGGSGATGIVVLRYITETPTILSQPLSDTTTAGIVETFTVRTSAAPTPLTKSVQWQFTADTTTGTTGWTNVSSGTGGTTDTFTTAALTKSMNKYRFRAIVTFSDTSTLSVQETSTVAILTINDSITITSDTSTITRKYGSAQTPPRTITYLGGTTISGAVGTSDSHTVSAAYGTLASGKIVLDTSTSTVVFRVDTKTAVGTYVETITVTDARGATATYAQRVVVTPADTLTISSETPTATTYTGAQAIFTETVTVTGLVAGDAVSSVTYNYSASAATCANGGLCSVGDIGPSGGYVFYVSPTVINVASGISTGGVYLEAAPVGGQGTAEFGCTGTETPGTSYAVGSGAANTKAIIDNCATAGIAARVISNLNNYAGFSDWFMPSLDEMTAIYNNLYNKTPSLGGFTGLNYGSSSEGTNGFGYQAYWWFGAGAVSGQTNKNYVASYRPIRAFNPTSTSSVNYGPSTTKPTNASTYTITPGSLILANNVDTSNYVSVVYRTSTFTINKARQDTLTVSSILGVYDTGTATMKLATLGGTDTGTVTYTIASGGTASGCSVSSNVLTVTSAGTCLLAATKAATINYLIAYSDTATITFTRFISNQQVQVQLYPTMIPINGANALETTTLTVPIITSVVYDPGGRYLVDGNFQVVAPFYTINGSGFTGATRVVLNFNDITPFTFNSNTKITIDAGGVTSGILFIECSDGRIGPTPFYNFVP
jgi:hypothetical protein